MVIKELNFISVCCMNGGHHYVKVSGHSTTTCSSKAADASGGQKFAGRRVDRQVWRSKEEGMRKEGTEETRQKERRRGEADVMMPCQVAPSNRRVLAQEKGKQPILSNPFMALADVDEEIEEERIRRSPQWVPNGLEGSGTYSNLNLNKSTAEWRSDAEEDLQSIATLEEEKEEVIEKFGESLGLATRGSQIVEDAYNKRERNKEQETEDSQFRIESNWQQNSFDEGIHMGPAEMGEEGMVVRFGERENMMWQALEVDVEDFESKEDSDLGIHDGVESQQKEIQSHKESIPAERERDSKRLPKFSSK